MDATTKQWIEVLANPALVLFFIGSVLKIAAHFIGNIRDERLRKLLLEIVKAAEQIYGDGEGSMKMEYVQRNAARKGLRVDNTDIEAAVYEVSRGREPPSSSEWMEFRSPN